MNKCIIIFAVIAFAACVAAAPGYIDGSHYGNYGLSGYGIGIRPASSSSAAAAAAASAGATSVPVRHSYLGGYPGYGLGSLGSLGYGNLGYGGLVY